MKCLKKYIDKEKARKYKKRHRELNYEKGDFSNGERASYDWEECEEILDHTIPDRELARKLERGVRAIQVKRCLLKIVLSGFPL